MKKFYSFLMLFFVSMITNAQFKQVAYRGAFAPAPAAMWTDNWTNFDPNNAVYPASTMDVATNITSDTHWTSCNTYLLKGQIYVKNNATLTIDPGVVIKGDATAVGAGLFVTKGAKLIAEGTAIKPIIFTSSNVAGSSSKGDWGGVILLGKASYNINNGLNNIEGIAASADTEYGGGTTPDDNDNSGSMKYVRIEFGGYIYAANQEINGLTFGAVGRGTTIDNVQVSLANDDSFEWFGGTVNCSHLLAFRGLDDDFDTDNGFSGKVQFCLGVRDPSISDNPTISTSNGFESDNNATSSSVAPYTECVFSNVTIVGPHFRQTLPNAGTLATGFGRAAQLRRNSKQKIFNTIFMDYNNGLHIDGVTTETNALNNELKFKNNIMAANTAAKVAYVNATGNNASFNISTWYAANNNTTVVTSAGLLTKPYDVTSALIFTGLDYRPATGSIANTGADFTDAAFGTAFVYTYFIDNDEDGFDNGSINLAIATAPAGFSATTLGTDCDDTNANVNTVCGPIKQVAYRGAFAPAPAAMWTDNWTNFDPNNAVYPASTMDVATNITSDTHWTSCNTYLLKGQIYVKNNATLTIDPGVVIKGDATAVGAGLFVTKGAKLIAEGTAIKPIIFTSSNVAGSSSKGDWGGVILLGKASYNINNGLNNIEGIAASADTEYGGGTTPDDNDNSGSMKYVRIEFGGYIYAANQEINGLTFGAVGRGTTIDNVQVSLANDDSFEWFGGTVNCSHLLAFRGLDDDFDTDNGFSGKVQFCLGVRDPSISDNPTISTSNGFESDNNATSSSVAPYTECVFSNVTIVGPHFRQTLPNAGTLATGFGRAAQLRRNSKQKIFNTIFMDYNNGLHIDGVTTETNALNNELKFKNNIMAANTAAKVAYVNATGNNASFNISTWYAANNNTTVVTSAGLLTKPYDVTSALIFTGLDYRPATGSIANTGADFTDAALLSNSSEIITASAHANVYPNPFSNNFKISFDSTLTDDVRITTIDMTGRIIEIKNVSFSEIDNLEIGSNYQSGMYLISVKQGVITKTLRVIKI